VIEPFEHLEVTYSGKVVILDDPLQMADPKKAFTENPYEQAEVHITYTRVSDMFGGEPDTPHEAPGEEFAKGHYEQLNKGVGSSTSNRSPAASNASLLSIFGRANENSTRPSGR